MALNTDRVGHVYEPYLYDVSREKIREYASALGESDPRYFSDGDDCVAPPTFAACFTVVKGGMPVIGDPELGAHMVLVHGSQRFEYGQRPMRPGDRLVCTPKVEAITHRGRNEFLTIGIHTTFEDSGELAVHTTQTIVFLGSAPQDEEASA